MDTMVTSIGLKGLSGEQARTLIPPMTILLAYRGSIAHGMYRNPEHDADAIDDKDLLGVCLAPLRVYWGLDTFEQSEKILGEWDVVVYELRKFVRLLCKGNPNVLSLLWNEPHHYKIIHPLGQRLLDHRDLFVSRQCYHAFVGYAHGQLHRMTHWSEGSYKTGYMGAKRKALVEKHGYDTKNAAHLIRLLRMGIEFLREGRLQVERKTDGPQLMEIKLGHWTLEQVKTEADHLFKRAEAAYDACLWPYEPDRDKVNALLIDILRDFWSPTFRD